MNAPAVAPAKAVAPANAVAPAKAVIPAKAGIQHVGSRLRGNDGWRRLFVAMVLAVTPFASAAPPTSPDMASAAPLQFQDAAEARRFRALVSELRCVMCQNQSLADSDALIAHALRVEVLHLMRQGLDNDEIKAYLVARYGEFVLYRPRVEPSTWLLWFGPGVLLLIGGFIVYRLARKGRGARAEVPEDQEQEW